ncbi:MAG: TadE family protein [Microbacterium sp. 14-71-5]|nr:MAG: TadE family protein [Microbacterium sp. 14-71-5]OZB84806.1 MAG: TadE family protein [Microbacterium sp. 13-71-7]
MLLSSRSPKPADPGVRHASVRAVPDEAGSAALEFIGLGVILLVPLVYLVLALGAIQGQMLGVESAARHTARTMSAAKGVADATARADAAVRSAIEEYGMDPATIDVDIRCTSAAVECPSAGATVVVTVTAEVTLPFVPPVFGLDRVSSVRVQASSAYKVSRTWTAG